MNNKLYIGITFAVIFLVVASIVGTSNKAITLENNIEESKSGIQIQEKRQHDLIGQLVQVVEHGANYEQTTQTQVAKLRTTAETSIVEAMTVISAVAEAYPELKANALYQQLMTELSISENLKAQYRDAYNRDVKVYKVHTTRFPNSLYLSLSNYQIKNFTYLEFDESQLSVPDQLFSEQ